MSRFQGCLKQEKQFLIPKKVAPESSEKKKDMTKKKLLVSSTPKDPSCVLPFQFSVKNILEYICKNFDQEVRKGLENKKFEINKIGVKKEDFEIIINFKDLQLERKSNLNERLNEISEGVNKISKDLPYSGFKITFVSNTNPSSLNYGRYVYPINDSCENQEKQGGNSSIPLTMNYADLQTFLQISMKKLDPKYALLTGKLSVSGNFKCLSFFTVLREIQKENHDNIKERQEGKWNQDALNYLEGYSQNSSSKSIKKKDTSFSIWNHTFLSSKPRDSKTDILEDGLSSYEETKEMNVENDKLCFKNIQASGKPEIKTTVEKSSHTLRIEGRKGSQYSKIRQLDCSLWEADPSVTACRICNTSFNMLKRKHHCRYCGRIVCHICSNQYVNHARCCSECMPNYCIGLRNRDQGNENDIKRNKVNILNERNNNNQGIKRDSIRSENQGENYDLCNRDELVYTQISSPLFDSTGSSVAEKGRHIALSEEIQHLKSRLYSMERKTLKNKAELLLSCSVTLTILFRLLMVFVITVIGSSIVRYVSLKLPLSCSMTTVFGSLYDITLIHNNILQQISNIFDWKLVLNYGLILSFTLTLFQRSYYRQYLAFTSLLVVIFHYIVVISKCKIATKKASEKMLENFHIVNAIFIKLNLFEMKGMYLKLGQYLSSRADLLDQCYIDELSAVQDMVTPTPFSATLRREIVENLKIALHNKKRIDSSEITIDDVDDLKTYFSVFEESAIASASIAQVHAAQMHKSWALSNFKEKPQETKSENPQDYIRSTIKVAVKLRHPHIKYTLRHDLENMRRLASVFAFIAPEMNMLPLFDEWSNELCHELDFKREYQNLLRAYRNLKESHLDVIIPKPILATESLLIMEFVEGFKITDEEKLREYQVDKRALMTNICDAYGHMMYKGGILHGDPHPGNILVNVSHNPFKVKPVILDWGLSKDVSKDVRLGNCLVVHSVNSFDIAGMNDGISRCGVDTEKMNLFEDLNTVRFMMRETQPMEEAQNENKKFIEKMIEKTKNELAQGGKPSNPLQSMVGELLFFARVTDLLQGLCSKLKVRVNYLEIMGNHARDALMAESLAIYSKNKKEMKSLLLVQSINDDNFNDKRKKKNDHNVVTFNIKKKRIQRLQERIQTFLYSSTAQSYVKGSQVVIYYKNQCLLNTATGTYSDINGRPITTRTLFCGYSMSNFLLSILIHQLIERKYIASLNTPICKIGNWSEFGQNGKESITLDDVLRHKAGLEFFLPEKLSFSLLTSGDKSYILNALEKATPLTKNNKRCSFHYFSFGWILSEVIERTTGKCLHEILKEFITAPLGIEDEMTFSKENISINLPSTQEKRTSSKTFWSTNDRIAYTASPEENIFFTDTSYDMQSLVKYQKENNIELKDLGALLLMDTEDLQEADFPSVEEPNNTVKPTVTDNNNRDDEHNETKKVTSLLSNFDKQPYLLDPRIMNSYNMRTKGFLPSLNAYFTASAYAKVLLSLSTYTTGHKLLTLDSVNEMQNNPLIEKPSVTKLFNRSENISLAAGCQIFYPKRKMRKYNNIVEAGNDGEPPFSKCLKGFGIASQGGQIAFLDPTLKFVVVVLSNTIPIMTSIDSTPSIATSNASGEEGYKDKNIILSQEIINIFNEEINRKDEKIISTSTQQDMEYNFW